MIELTFSKPSQIGEVKVVLRIIRHILYFKYTSSKEMEQMIRQFALKGVKFRKSNNWLEVDLFRDNTIGKFGDYEIDLEEDDADKIERKLAEFYTVQYIKMGFKLE